MMEELDPRNFTAHLGPIISAICALRKEVFHLSERLDKIERSLNPSPKENPFELENSPVEG
jgi:hypothetical protein